MSDLIQDAKRLLALAKLEKEKTLGSEDSSEMKKNYSDRLIRVHSEYTQQGFESPFLIHVCTWSDGDEGFILVPGKIRTDQIAFKKQQNKTVQEIMAAVKKRLSRQS